MSDMAGGDVLAEYEGSTVERCAKCYPEWSMQLSVAAFAQPWLKEINKVDVIYISGPMTGLPNNNEQAFYRMEDILLRYGCQVFSPARYANGEETFTYAQLMRRDIKMLCHCTKVVALLGHENSKGAKIELAVAQICEIPIYYEQQTQQTKIVATESGKTTEAESGASVSEH